MTNIEKQSDPGATQNESIIKTFDPLVRIAHWSNVFILLSLGMSGLSIYWASPVFKFDLPNGQLEPFAFIGSLCLKAFPDEHESARNWFFNHFAMGSGNLAYSLNIHWLFAYLFMGSTFLYVLGSLRSGSYRALLPRRGDITEGFQMVKFYLSFLPSLLLRKTYLHPQTHGKYNALQRFAYFSSLVSSLLAITTGWAMHKPSELGWLQLLCGGYDFARVLHFLTLLFFSTFVVPHTVLVITSGWDCMRSMILGWSTKKEV